MIKKTRLFPLLLVITFFYLVVIQLWAVWPFTIDDMYITLRYAKNWASGYGLLWNIGDLPVEGYSNFSFVLLGRGALVLGLDPVLVLKGFGVFGLLLTCWSIYLISRFWLKPNLALIPCLLILAYKGQILWSVSGLETTTYEALICFSVYFILCGLGCLSGAKPYHYRTDSSDICCTQKGNYSGQFFFIVSGCLVALAGMTRPEAPALMALLVLILVFNRERSMNNWLFWVCLGLFCLAFSACFLPYFWWRWNYYGRLFPNPVYCKGFSNVAKFHLDINYLRLIGPFFLFALPALIGNKDKRYYFLCLPSVLYLLLLIGSDPIVAFDNRLFLPAFVLFVPLAIIGIVEGLSWYLKTQNGIFNMVVYYLAFLLAFFFIPMMTIDGYLFFIKSPLSGRNLRQQVAAWLGHNIPEHSQIVLADAGLIPYLTPYRFIDSYCLNNAEMSKYSNALMYETMCSSVMVMKPEVIILTSMVEDDKVTYTPTDACLSKKLKVENSYCMRASFSTSNNSSMDVGYYRYQIYRPCYPSISNL